MRPFAVLLLSFAVCSCAELQQAVSTKPLTDTAPEPNTPLSVPTENMTGAKGPASAPYPNDYGVTVKNRRCVDRSRDDVDRRKDARFVFKRSAFVFMDALDGHRNVGRPKLDDVPSLTDTIDARPEVVRPS